MADELPEHLDVVRALPCCAPGAPDGCGFGASAHHPTQLRESGHDARRAHDLFAIPLCALHHHDLHRRCGDFKTWDWLRLCRWEFEKIVETLTKTRPAPRLPDWA